MKSKKNERTGHTAGFDPKFVSKKKSGAAGSFQNKIKRSMHGNSPLHTLAGEEEDVDEFDFDRAMEDNCTPL